METVKESISRKRPPDMAKKEGTGGLLETVKENISRKRPPVAAKRGSTGGLLAFVDILQYVGEWGGFVEFQRFYGKLRGRE